MDSALKLSLVVLAYYIIRIIRTDCDLQVSSTSKRPSYFKNKRVWVTGASSGIGREICRIVASYGGQLLLSSRSESNLTTVKLELEAKYPGLICKVLVLDLAEISSLNAKAKEAKELMGGDIDILVNNGGVSQRSFALDSVFDTDKHILNVDFVSATVLSKALLQGWMGRVDKTQKGILNISSLAGKMGSPLRTNYSGAKFALIGFMDALRTEISHEEHVTITNICPGSVCTDVSKNSLTGSVEKTFGSTDVNIANGMNVTRCAQLCLNALANELEEAWFFGSAMEKFGAYFSQYAPGLFRFLANRGKDKLIKNARDILAKNNS